MGTGTLSPDTTVRALHVGDLERVIAIDQAHSGTARRRFMERRLAAGAQSPDEYVLIGLEHSGTLVGFALGRLLYGEFGRVEPVAVLDAIGVDRSSQEHGYGHALMAGLLAAVRRRGARQLHSQADWTNHGLLKFFDSAGFKLAQRVVLERGTAQSMDESGEDI
jgi:GNAT superfamily N-acetyltransferase